MGAVGEPAERDSDSIAGEERASAALESAIRPAAAVRAARQAGAAARSPADLAQQRPARSPFPLRARLVRPSQAPAVQRSSRKPVCFARAARDGDAAGARGASPAPATGQRRQGPALESGDPVE